MKLSRSSISGIVLALMMHFGWSAVVYAADPANGAQLYARHCTTCHGDRGRPTLPGIPDFSRRERLMQPDRDLITAIKAGKGVMPAYLGLLTDDEMLDVIAHLRSLR